jgi:hypothetical protein
VTRRGGAAPARTCTSTCTKTRTPAWRRVARSLACLGGTFVALVCVPIAARAALHLDVEGNVALNDEVYRVIADLPPAAPADEATAKLAGSRIRTFLHRAGYELAEVEACVVEGRVVIKVDEGRLEKVVVRGGGAVATVLVQLELALPGQIFNRPELERQLRELASRHGFTDLRYEIVPVREVAHEGVQIEEIGLVHGKPLVRVGEGRYELHVIAGARTWDQGADYTLRVRSDQVVGGAGYRGVGTLMADDRWHARAEAGIGFVEDLVGKDSFVLDRAGAELRWYTPAMAGALRPFLDLRGDADREQRADLDVASLWWSRVTASANFAWTFDAGPEVSAGGGVQLRRLSRVRQDPATTGMLLTGFSHTRPFVRFGCDCVLDPLEMRDDRHHRVVAEVTWFAEPLGDEAGGTFARFEIDYQKVFELGWHDLWLRGTGAALVGDRAVPDEVPLGGSYLRGVFGRAAYSPLLGRVGLDFRYSLTRDVIKIGAFTDVVAYDESDLAETDPKIRAGGSLGPGFHVLVLNAVQIDVFYAVGLLSDGRVDHGGALFLKKAY